MIEEEGAMPAKIDSEVGECLDIMIGCLREIQRNLWQQPTETHKSAIKDMPELSVMESTIAVLRQGNYEDARQVRPEEESKYLS